VVAKLGYSLMPCWKRSYDMKRRLWFDVALTALLIGAAPLASAQETVPESVPTLGQPQAVDASTIVGKDIYDANGVDIGNIDAVLVNAAGQVQSVVVDVSGWLEDEKLLNLAWSDLAQGADGKIIAVSLTKEQADQAQGYAYREGQRGGQVLTEDGEPYIGAVAGAGSGSVSGTNPIVNGDGTVNTSHIIGAALESDDGDKVGEIDEVVIHPDGKIQGVVVNVGGVLGVGAHTVLLDWREIELAHRAGEEVLVVNATEDSLKTLPEYAPSPPN
jgi:sporulation protein YlmC with PRC-barrel domain